MRHAAVPLDEIVTIAGGGTPSTNRPEYFRGHIPWVSPKDMKCWDIVDSMDRITEEAIANSSTTLIARDAVLVVTRSGVLKHTLPVAINRVPVTLNQDMKALICGERVIPEYLARALQALSPKLLQTVRGTTADNLSTDVLRALEIPLPTLPEQRRIAGRLEQADRLRRTRRYALQLTDTFLPAAFLELFGDPAENSRAFDRVQVEDLFAHSRDGAKCGPFGSALKKHEYVATGIPVWTMNNVGANQFVEDRCLYITPEKFEELAAYDAQNGDILISRAGTVGRMAIVRTKHPRSIIHSNIIRLSLNNAKILPIYFVALMTWFAPRVARLKRGQEDAYTFMSTGSLGELQIPLPPLLLQQKFAALVERVERLRAVQREALRQAEHLFATLLYRAFSG